MAKIKFMPVENPIDKLYSSATGMPFPVSAAAGQSSEPDPGPKPEPTPVCATPVITSVNGYEYCETNHANIPTGVATVTITCSTDGADIYYKKTGDADYTLYKDPFTVESSTQVEAYASKKDYDDSVKTTSLVTVYEAETCPEPGPGPIQSEAVAEVTYDDSDHYTPFRISVQVPVPEQISSVEDITGCDINIGFNDQWDPVNDMMPEFGAMNFDCSTEENSLQIVDDLLEIRGFENNTIEDVIPFFCENYNSEDTPYPYACIRIYANEDPETGEGDDIVILLSWTFTGETPCNIGE